MQRYLIRRISLFLPTILIASFMVFGLMRFLPGDVALVILGGDTEQEGFYQEDIQNLRDQLGLLDPFYVQYGKWIWSMSSGNYGGESLFTNEPIGEIIGRRMPVTLQLTMLTMTIAISISLPLGVLAALNQNRWPDYIARSITILGLALPNFWVALLVILGLVLVFHWSPPIIYVNSWQDPWTYIQIAIWPSLVLAWGYSSSIARITRSNMVEVLRQDYVRTAHSKGLAQRTVIWRHALRNSLIPVVTLAGGYFDSLLSGTVILENIFGIPGMGQGIVQAAVVRDYPVIQSLSLLLVFFALALNLVIDLLYVFIDPRISYE